VRTAGARRCPPRGVSTYPVAVSGLLEYWYVFAAVSVVVFASGVVRRRKRRAGLGAYAHGKGWRYVEDDPSLVTRFQGPPFGRGGSRRARNVMVGSHEGRHVVAFDYSYTTSTGSGSSHSTSSHYWSILAMHVGHPMPRLEVTPLGLVSGLVDRLVNTDQRVGSEEFNRAFRVGADSPRFAADVLTPAMEAVALRQPEIGWRFDGDSLVSVRKGHQSVDEIEAKLAHLDAILDNVPEVVWREIRGGR